MFIGLFVVIFIVALLLGRINLKGQKKPQVGGALGRIFGLSREVTPKLTPTPTGTQKIIAIKKTVESDGEGETRQTGIIYGTKTTTTAVTKGEQPISQIPNTGPSILFPIAAISFAAGVYLKRKS